MTYRVGVVGAGPTAIYSLQSLVMGTPRPTAITVFERQRRAGRGTPYSPHWSDPLMLANIASIEIPALPQRLVEWLRNESDVRLAAFGIARSAIDERAFYPRLVVGDYLAAQFWALVQRARSLGIDVEVNTQATVTDVCITGGGVELEVTMGRDGARRQRFDYVILATGHQWPENPELRPGYFTSPWPASALERIRNCAVGIRGTSLSAIDACVALADQHGEFVPSGETLQYRARAGTEAFSIRLFSRKGILPEADFFHPIPYEPLQVCTAETMRRLIRHGDPDGLLDAAFDLFRQEMLRADARYVCRHGLTSGTLEEFCGAYFDARESVDPFEWARKNLDDAVDNARRRVTVTWRYAILRMHEVFGLLPPHLNDDDFERFSVTLKPVFVDNYATVPHESIRRLLALHAAGKLRVSRLRDGARFDTHSAERGALLIDGTAREHFPAFIDATGQRALGAKDFPFPSLLRQGAVTDAAVTGESAVSRGIAVDSAYHPLSDLASSERLFCLSIPFLLGEHPFSQGMTSSAEMAEVVAEAIQHSETTRALCRSGDALCAT